MIDLETLRNVKTIVSHEGRPDGIAAALLAKDAIPGARILFVNYNTTEHRSLPAEPHMLFTDMTPPRERVEEFVEAGAIVLDHHEGARDLVERFGVRGVYSAEPGVSGAVLAYREVWLPTAEAKREECEVHAYLMADGHCSCPLSRRVGGFAKLAGIRDTWQRSAPEWNEACAQAAALRFWPWESLAAEFEEGGDCWSGVWEKLKTGPILLAKDAEHDARTLREAHCFSVSGVRVVCFEGTHTSDIADRLSDEADLVLGWHYRLEEGKAQMVVSCRSRGQFSALGFAWAYRGGGHRQAAGFVLPIHYREYNPYEHVRRMVEQYCGEGDGPTEE